MTAPLPPDGPPESPLPSPASRGEGSAGTSPLPSPASRGEGSAGTSPLPSPASRGDGSPGTSGARLAAFGRWLARERELRGLGRDEVTRAMKLAPGVVEALESGEEARMPPRAYAVGYLRSYASAVGLDADEVVLRFEEAARRAGGAGRAKRPPALLPGVVIAIVVALAVAGAGVWALLR